MKTTLCLTLTLLTFATFAFVHNSLAQDYIQWHLPEGAKARLGKGNINEIKYSPDDTKLAVAGNIGIWIYDAQTGGELDLFTGYTRDVNSVSFSPDGNTLASVASEGSDTTIRLWDTNSGEHTQALTGHTDDVNIIAFSPVGKTLASGSRSDEPSSEVNTVRLWDVETGKEQAIFSGHLDQVNSVAFSPDCTTLATGSDDGTILLWDTHALPELPASAAKVSLSPSSLPSPTPSEILTFSLNISEGQNVSGYQATVTFDDTAIRYVSAANGGFLPAARVSRQESFFAKAMCLPAGSSAATAS